MSDAAARRLLEETQAEVKILERRVREWPLMGPALKEQRASIRALETEVKALGLRIDGCREREVTLRSTRSPKWWRSPLAPWMLALPLMVGWIAAYSLLNRIDWWFWSGRLGFALMALPVVVNLARFTVARIRRRRRQRRLSPQ